MGTSIVFDYMCRDDVKTHVEVDCINRKVSVTNYTDVILDQALGLRPATIENIQYFFKDRCFEETRPDKDTLLELLGLTQYNPYDIVKQTRGRMWGDDFWIRFEGDTATWADVINQK